MKHCLEGSWLLAGVATFGPMAEVWAPHTTIECRRRKNGTQVSRRDDVIHAMAFARGRSNVCFPVFLSRD